LSKGAKLNSEGTICNAASTQYKNTIKTVSFLIKRGIDINAKTKHGSTALHCAMNKQPEVVQLLIKSDANLDDEDRYRRTPVFNADERFIDYLINAGANVNYVSKHGDTPLFASFTRHGGKTTIPLIEGWANINIRNDYHLTPLIVAAITLTNETAIKYLINSGADKSVSASIDMINEYSKLFRKKILKTDKIELTAYDIAVIK